MRSPLFSSTRIALGSAPRTAKATFCARAWFVAAALALLVVGAWCVPAVVLAQDASDVNDVVVLQDGSFVRGTLIEYAAGQYAVLLTRGGQMRRFEHAEIRYAGPASSMPSAEDVANVPASNPPSPASSPPSPDANPTEVHFEADSPVQVFQRTGVSTSLAGNTTGESYAPLCRAPCSAVLAPGSYTLGLADGDGAPVRSGTLSLAPGSVVKVEYHSRAHVRAAGFVLGLGALVGGLVLSLSDIDDGLGPRFYGGLVLMGTGSIAGTILGCLPDTAVTRLVR